MFRDTCLVGIADIGDLTKAEIHIGRDDPDQAVTQDFKSSSAEKLTFMFLVMDRRSSTSNS